MLCARTQYYDETSLNFEQVVCPGLVQGREFHMQNNRAGYYYLQQQFAKITLLGKCCHAVCALCVRQ